MQNMKLFIKSIHDSDTDIVDILYYHLYKKIYSMHTTTHPILYHMTYNKHIY
jgi:hypothetical protein